MSGKPEKPNPEDCCGSGCSPCILDVYEQQLKLWEEKKLPQSLFLLDPLKLTPFQLKSVKEIVPDTNLYTFQAVNENNEPVSSKIDLKMGDYFMLKGEIGSENFSRPYTPIINDLLNLGQFQVIVKLYKDGKMSNYFKKTAPGDVSYWRGPYNHFSYVKSDHIVLLGAGTGVAPLYNVAYSITQDEACETLIKFFCCFSNLQGILLRNELNELASYWNCSVQFFISEKSNNPTFHRENVQFSRLDFETLEQICGSYRNKDVLFVICGPDMFVEVCRRAVSGFEENRIVVL